MTESKKFPFRSENRVLKRADFLAAYEAGKSYRRKAMHVFIASRESPELPTRLGVTVTRKVSKAVGRNRLKRLGREVFRLSLPGLKPGYTIIVNYHRAALKADFAELQSQLHSVWREAGIFRDDFIRAD